jgi:hypothetical protein
MKERQQAADTSIGGRTTMVEKRIARAVKWGLLAGTAVGIMVFALLYRQTDGWAENTTKPDRGRYEQVTFEDLEAWPWTYKHKLVVITGEVRQAVDGKEYIDPLVQLFGRRVLGGVRVQRQVILSTEGPGEAIVAIDFWTPPELPARLTVSGRVRGPRALSNPLGDEPELPVVEAYEICAEDGDCWSP